MDVVEGVTVQTHALLSQAHQEGLRPCLVLNKIDRLILELSLSPVETYDRLAKIVDQANSIMSSLYLQSKMKDTEHNLDLKLDKDEERAHFFRPALSSNVIFCSAIDGFGFTVRSMARQFWRSDKKFGLGKISQLERVLWSNKFRISDDRTYTLIPHSLTTHTHSL